MSHDLTRRDFLRTGAAVAAAASLPAIASAAPAARVKATADACIFINLVGGPSQLDTFDPKPNAPSDVRGPFRPIPTRVPGVHLSELFPKLASMADRFSLIRSMHHDAAPIHETGFQLLNTGHLFRDGPEWPSVGAVVDHLFGRKMPEVSSWAVWPNPIEVTTGITVSHGLGTGWLRFGAVTPSRLHPEYHPTTSFAECCSLLPILPHVGCRFLTLNMFSTVFDAPSWDCHADRGSLATDLNDYRETVAPMFDVAFSKLLVDLETSGLLERTLVVATGEFGRTPHPNANGGRDHWPGCWTALVAGGGVKGGRVVGASDAIASAPADRPVTPQELVATIYQALGVGPDATIPGPDGRPVRVIDAEPVRELF